MKPRGSAVIRGQTEVMRYFLGLVVLLLLLLPSWGCSQRERRRHPDDVRVQIRVERTELRGWAKPDELEMTVTKGLFEGTFSPQSGENFIVGVAFILVCATVEMTIERSLSAMRGTTLTLSVPEYPRYRQRLVWGDNRVYLPAELAGTSAGVIIRAKGAWRGRQSVQLHLAPQVAPPVEP